MKNKYEERIARLQAKFADAGIDGLYINHVENVSYFTGKKGNDCTLWITPTRATILTDFRYVEQAERQAPGTRVMRYGGDVKRNGLLLQQKRS